MLFLPVTNDINSNAGSAHITEFIVCFITPYKAEQSKLFCTLSEKIYSVQNCMYSIFSVAQYIRVLSHEWVFAWP